MTPTDLSSPASTVHERYRSLQRAGFTEQESASLIACADGIDRHAEGELPSGVIWRWQEIARLEFLRYLVDTGRLSDAVAPGLSCEDRVSAGPGRTAAATRAA